MPVSKYTYLWVLLVPLSLPIAVILGLQSNTINIFVWMPVVMLELVLPVLDWVVSPNRKNRVAETRQNAMYFNGLLVVLAFAYLFSIWFVIAQLPMLTLSIWGWLGLVSSMGYVSGISGINLAHELIHKRSVFLQNLGGVLLSMSAYGSFKVEHVRGHHVHVATPLDRSSAALGENVFVFMVKAIVRNPIAAWQLENKRLASCSPWKWLVRHEVLRWSALTLLANGVSFVVAGWPGVLLFVAQAWVSVALLETINFVEHYGLRRKRLKSGRYARPSVRDSWNSDAVVSNILLLQLPRHSDHHAHATRPYFNLRHHDESPQLPASYSVMVLLAWMPPLWRRIMDPRVAKYSNNNQIITE